MKKNTKEKGCIGNLYILSPTLENMARHHGNLKAAAAAMDLEYSNLIKKCKFDRNIGLETYAKCALAFNMDVVILHLPKGFIMSKVATKIHESHRFYTIDKKNIITLLNALCELEAGHLEEYMLQAFYQIVRQHHPPPSDYVQTLEQKVMNIVNNILKNHGD